MHDWYYNWACRVKRAALGVYRLLTFEVTDQNGERTAASCIRIIRALQDPDGTLVEHNFSELVRRTGLTPKTISKRTTQLVSMGAIGKRVVAAEALYKLTRPDPVVFRYFGSSKHRKVRWTTKRPTVQPLPRVAGKFVRIQHHPSIQDLPSRVPWIQRLPGKRQTKIRVWGPPVLSQDRSGERKRITNLRGSDGSEQAKQGSEHQHLLDSSLTRKQLDRQLRGLAENSSTNVLPTEISHPFLLRREDLNGLVQREKNG